MHQIVENAHDLRAQGHEMFSPLFIKLFLDFHENF
jgi:hypothetical protein